MLETRAFILGFSSPVGGVNIAKSWLLWRVGRPMKGCSCLPERYTLFPASFHSILLEQSQDECLESTQTPGPGSSKPAEGRGLGHHCSGVSAHRALPPALHGSLLWELQWDTDSHGASMALCPPGSGGTDGDPSSVNLTSSAGWTWHPACSEGSPQVSLIQVDW